MVIMAKQQYQQLYERIKSPREHTFLAEDRQTEGQTDDTHVIPVCQFVYIGDTTMGQLCEALSHCLS